MLHLSQPGKRRLAYGFWRYGEADLEHAETMLSLAREHGIDHLDTADVYGGKSGFGASERMLGRLRERAPSLFSGAALATKIGIEPGVPYNSSAAHLKSACDGCLTRLKAERIDLLHIHRPDLLTHPRDLAQTLDGLVASGKAATVGVSNFTVAQVAALARYLKTPIAAHQLEFSAAHFAPLFDGTLDQAMERQIAVLAWSPLAGGRLRDNTRVYEALEAIARKHGVSPATIAIAFLHGHPAAVTPILGTKTPERLREAAAAKDVTLTRAEWYAVLEAARGARMP